MHTLIYYAWVEAWQGVAWLCHGMARHSVHVCVDARVYTLIYCACTYARESEAKKQAKHAQQVREKQQRTLDAFGNAHWMLFVLPRPLEPMWLRLALVSLNLLSPRNPLWLPNLNPNPILTARERKEPLPHNNRNHRLKKPRKGSNPMNLEHSPRRRWQK